MIQLTHNSDPVSGPKSRGGTGEVQLLQSRSDRHQPLTGSRLSSQLQGREEGGGRMLGNSPALQFICNYHSWLIIRNSSSQDYWLSLYSCRCRPASTADILQFSYSGYGPLLLTSLNLYFTITTRWESASLQRLGYSLIFQIEQCWSGSMKNHSFYFSSILLFCWTRSLFWSLCSQWWVHYSCSSWWAIR